MAMAVATAAVLAMVVAVKTVATTVPVRATTVETATEAEIPVAVIATNTTVVRTARKDGISPILTNQKGAAGNCSTFFVFV